MPASRESIGEFLRFGVVGVIGFLVDTAVVYATRDALGVYLAGGLAYVAAVTSNFFINRAWTFRGRGHGHTVELWSKYLAIYTVGIVPNRGAYVIALALSPFIRAHPVFAVAAGSIAGMGFNFFLARRFVFTAPAIGSTR